jgi:hypothetical protein
MRIRVLISILVVGGIGLACSAPHRAYPGRPQPPDQVALLETDPKVRILKLDGREYFHRNLEILPGQHAVGIKFVVDGEELSSSAGIASAPGTKSAADASGQRLSFICQLSFNAEADRAYRIERISPKPVKGVPARFGAYDFGGVTLIELANGEEILSVSVEECTGES